MTGKHYTKEELELYRHDKMSILARIKCRSHLKTCPECTRLLEDLQEDDAFLQQFRQSMATYDTACEDTKLPPIK